MSTIKQKQAAKLINEYQVTNIVTGERVNLSSILESVGYTAVSAKQCSRLMDQAGFKEALKLERDKTQEIESSFEKRFISLQDKLLTKLEEKGLSSASYRDLKDLLSTSHNILRLIQQRSTHNVAVESNPILTDEDARRYLKETLGLGYS